MNQPSKLNRIYSITLDYFKSSLKSISTWILIIFNLSLLFSLYLKKISLPETILSYLLQATILVILFGITFLSLRQFISVNKKVSGKGIIFGTSIFAIFLWIFYGIALYMLYAPIINQVRISLNFIISIGILLLQSSLFFILNFKKERERLENTDLVKSFFEPAGNIFPIYIAILFMMVIGQAGVIIIIKTLADIIISSPLNADEPYLYKILYELKNK